MYNANDIPLCDKSDMAMNAVISYNGTTPQLIAYQHNKAFTYQQVSTWLERLTPELRVNNNIPWTRRLPRFLSVKMGTWAGVNVSTPEARKVNNT